MLESLIQNNDLVAAHHLHIVKYILPALMDSIQSGTNSDMRVESLRMMSEMTAMMFGGSGRKRTFEFGQESREMLKAAVESDLIQT